jgi:D-alanyl-D-alanine dipeptidase
MVGVYDEMSERPILITPAERHCSALASAPLRHAMEAEGFTVNEVEWWH